VVSATALWIIENKEKRLLERKIRNENPNIMFGLLLNDIDWSNLDSTQYIFTQMLAGELPLM